MCGTLYRPRSCPFLNVSQDPGLVQVPWDVTPRGSTPFLGTFRSFFCGSLAIGQQIKLLKVPREGVPLQLLPLWTFYKGSTKNEAKRAGLAAVVSSALSASFFVDLLQRIHEGRGWKGCHNGVERRGSCFPIPFSLFLCGPPTRDPKKGEAEMVTTTEINITAAVSPPPPPF